MSAQPNPFWDSDFSGMPRASFAASAPVDLARLSGEELDEYMTLLEVDRIAIEARQVAVLREAIRRGQTGGPSTGPIAKSAAKAWLRDRLAAASVAPPEPAMVAELVEVATGLQGPDAAGFRDAVDAGLVSRRKAWVAIREMGRLAPRLVERAAEAVWTAYATLAQQWVASDLQDLRPAMLARYGRDEDNERDLDAAKRATALSAGVRDGLVYDYRLSLDAESHAVLEAAIGPVSAPVPGLDGSPDLRSAAQRRGQGLVELIRGAVAAGAAGAGAARAGSVKAQLFLTVTAADLAEGRGFAEVLGSTAAGVMLPASVVSRVACDAALVPTVLGVHGEVLELGHAQRLFSAAQRKALMLRDRHCSFPGCTVPATWTDAHHLKHWLHGGRTDLSNAAMLCGRHHTVVHRRRLLGRIEPDTGHVRWDLAPGSYDRAPGSYDRAPGNMTHNDDPPVNSPPDDRD